ncbi:hypothetical protein KVR01_010578 [Diaporthe batatas]|uniref:uncharacterized protein n=1 Tax=Diaporthe batatas TaxID=748121 RepID=UPI001D05B63F|nr:uncharacterized protein KVR01_010578 [Diaporthe batatas]KAG8159941.1 hypothetical protein KVR01_010578 [Diaporthe batatas]
MEELPILIDDLEVGKVVIRSEAAQAIQSARDADSNISSVDEHAQFCAFSDGSHRDGRGGVGMVYRRQWLPDRWAADQTDKHPNGLGAFVKQIFLSYCDPDNTCTQRREHLFSYGFNCDCPLCVAEDTIPAILNKRAELIEESNNFITTSLASADLSKLSETTICAAEEFRRQLEVNGTPEEKLTRALNALRNYWYFVQIGNSVRIDRSTAVPLGPAITIALVATTASLQLGKTEVASQLQNPRKEIYIIIHGFESGRGLEDMDRDFGI